jgi:formate-dependent nitrite reductase cytochrome c552 subunit
LALAIGAALADYALHAAEDAPAKKQSVPAKNEKPLVAPPKWPADQPLPTVASNCARCHLTAGRELTAAVANLAHSVHDLNGLTCYDCHGGNPHDDVSAHEPEHGFIGTKLSAHLKTCSECHDEPATELAAGPHHWDFSKKINTNYPTCIDCHGNHDISNPPEDFRLKAVCLDCHESLVEDWPNLASVVDENDALWQALHKIRIKNRANLGAAPEPLQPEVDRLRHETMLLMHGSKEISAETAAKLNGQVKALRGKLETSLK